MTLEELGLTLVRFGLSIKEAGNFTRKLDADLRWQAARDYAGYGAFTFGYKTWKAHRLVYAATHPGEDISKLFVVQTCGDLVCCDPKCLHTQKKRPMRCYAEEYRGKISAKTAERLRRMPFEETNKCELARSLGVSPCAVSRAMRGITHNKRVRCEPKRSYEPINELTVSPIKINSQPKKRPDTPLHLLWRGEYVTSVNGASTIKIK